MSTPAHKKQGWLPPANKFDGDTRQGRNHRLSLMTCTVKNVKKYDIVVKKHAITNAQFQ